MPRVHLMSQRQFKLPGGGIANVLPPRDVRDQVAAAPSVRFRYPEATVSGQATVWRDESGVDVVSPFPQADGNGMRCTCGKFSSGGRDEHIEKTLHSLGDAYGPAPTGDTALRPGVSMAELWHERTSNTAYDVPRAPLERMNYSRIQNLRAQRQDTTRKACSRSSVEASRSTHRR